MAPIIEKNNVVGGGTGRVKYASATYDSAVDGKTEGSKTLKGEAIPSGAVILDTLIVVDTAPTSGGEAKIAVTVESAGDVQAAKKVSEAPWSATGAKRGAITATSTPVVTTAARQIVAKIETAALTAGKFRVLVAYVELG